LIENTSAERAQKWRGSLLNNIGWTYHDKGDFLKALDMFEQALIWHEQYMQDKPDRIRIAKWCVGRTFRSLKRYDDALQIQEALAEEHKQLNNPPDGFVVEEIGECLLALGQTEAAKPYFTQAYEQLSKISWVENDRLERLKQLTR
jgi:tetratricopeptide (TPR) repeat protein